MIGKQFNNLTVIEFSHCKNSHRFWLCACNCGNQKVIREDHFRSYRIKGCGCSIGLGNLKHGHCAGGRYSSLTYRAWQGMFERCYNTKCHAYNNYGGRGIKVCDRWYYFENFLEDMGEKPGSEYSLDRYPNNNGNYEPENCRWATWEQQNRNKRNYTK